MRIRHTLPLLPLTFLLAACQDAALPTVPHAPRADVVASAALTVNLLTDAGDGVCGDGSCTLRDAITSAAPGDQIGFSVTGTIGLTGGQLVIDRGMSIAGPGADQLTVSATGPSRVLYVLGTGTAPVQISGLTIANGDMNGPGGCIQSEGSTLTLQAVVVADCRSQGAGGAIGSSGDASGVGRLNIDHSTVRGSWAANGGGGVYNNHNSYLFIRQSTIALNEGREGGGVGSTGYAVIVSSTVSGNRARFHGGGVYAADRDDAGMQVTWSTIVGNVADSDGNGDGDGGGFYNSDAYFSVTGSIVANNDDAGRQAPDCGAFNPTPAQGAVNLIEDLTGCTFYGASATVQADPLLGPLTDNGGATLTHLPLAGSPAIDAGGTVCEFLDQRDLPHLVGAACDIGAVEVQPLTVSIDIRPGSTENPVSLKLGGMLPVAVLGSASFDASTIVVSTVQLAGAGVAPRPKTQGGGYMASLEDVNADGYLDLVAHFSVKSLGLTLGTTSLTLTATLTTGAVVAGSDLVRVMP